jgi:serine phosphatase RsbU (regulator of sigma subunit)
VPSLRSRLLYQASLAELVRTLPARQLLLFWLALFTSFASMAFLLDVMGGGRTPIVWIAANALVSGGVAVASTATLMRRQWIAFAVVVFAFMVYMLAVIPDEPRSPPGRLFWDAILAVIGMAVGVSLFSVFMDVTAAQHLKARAELAVAHEIHEGLVPAIEQTIGEYEFYGWSVASGPMGGDLVDLVQSDQRWLGYVADVSGHGVGAGIVMAMFKSALRTRLLTDSSIAALLDHVQTALMPLKQPQMYVTVACVRGGPDGQVECATAGHLPILRARAGVVEEMTTPQLAVGMFDGAAFTSTRIDCQTGDVLALLTDGLVEVFDAAGRELGVEWAKALLAASADRPLRDIGERLLTGARNHGAQLDDQSLLLIRRAALV